MMHGNINVKEPSGSSVFSGLFIIEEAERAGDKGSGGFTMVDVHTLLEACDLPDPLMLFLMVKTKTSILETTFYKCWIIRISGLLGIKI